jgi:hypothetical protein
MSLSDIAYNYMTMYKPKKRSSVETDNPILNRLDILDIASDVISVNKYTSVVIHHVMSHNIP